MKKCKGCGVTLQFKDVNLAGYTKDDSFDYCQRCFRLTHYGDIKHLKKDLKTNKELKDFYNDNKDGLFVLIVDIFDALIINEDNLLNDFINKNLIVIINKIDLLPKNINEEKIERVFKELLNKYQNYKNINFILTYKNDYTFNKLFFDIVNEYDVNKLIFVGRANAGKSTIINKLLKNNDLTTSIYPGTSYDINEIKYDNYLFIDTPGLIDEESILSYLQVEKIKKILPLKTIKAQNFQFYQRQSYFVEGLLRVDIVDNKKGNILFMLNNNIEVHRSKYENGDRYLNNNEDSFTLKLFPLNKNEYKINNYQTFIIKGLGLFKIKGNLKINIWVNDKIKVYQNEVDI